MMTTTANMMSLRKVPCTPVTGVDFNFYDVFGEVERVGTGSSVLSIASNSSSESIINGNYGDQLAADRDEHEHEQIEAERSFQLPASSLSTQSSSGSMAKETGKSGRTDERLQNWDSSFYSPSQTSQSNCSYYKIDLFGEKLDPYVIFLQEKQAEILKALHEEVRLLKQENSDLKFQVHVILCEEGRTKSQKFHSKDDSLKSKKSNVLGTEREKTLELELESATKLIEELKWIKRHYERKLKIQEQRIEDLMSKRHHHSYSQPISPISKDKDGNDFPIGGGAVLGSTTKSKADSNSNTNLYNLMSGIRRVSTPIILNRANYYPTPDPTFNLSRRNSAQSILPENYKERVATLPPIMSHDLQNENDTRENCLSASKHKKRNADNNSRKSSLTNLNSIPYPGRLPFQ